MRLRRGIALVMVALIALQAVHAGAQEILPDAPLPPILEDQPVRQSEALLVNSDDLAAFVDGVVQATMQREHIAGVTVAVVDREKNLLLRGYGSASIDPARSVDPTTTLFRIGSVSKTFTYVAAMQLVEQGKLDLGAEANRYLPESLKLADDGYAPVLIRHLLTHSAGFEDSALGHLFTFSPDAVPTLESYLAAHRPKRVRPADQYAVYSNYSVALLGEIVAQIAGKPFEQHIEETLLKPLNMSHTTFREPLKSTDARRVDDRLLPDWSRGFVWEKGGYVAKPFEYITPLAPAGSASSSAGDMARWLRMLLAQGELDGARVMQSATFETLANVSFRNADAVGGIAHGFFSERYGVHESLEHAGATLWFHSNLVTIPDTGIGIFVSANTDNGFRLTRELPRLIVQRLIDSSRPTEPPLPPSDFSQRAADYIGSYLAERRNFSTVEKLFGAFGSGSTISSTKDGYLLITTDAGERRFVEESPDVFRATDGGERIAFLRTPDGDIEGFAGSYGHDVQRRSEAMDAPSLLQISLASLALICLGVLLCAWRRSALPERARIRDATGTALLVILTSLGWLTWFVLAGVALSEMSVVGGEIVSTYPTPIFRTAVVCAWVVSGLSVLCALLLPAALGAKSWSFGRKLRHVIVVILMLATVALFVRWNLLFAPIMLAT